MLSWHDFKVFCKGVQDGVNVIYPIELTWASSRVWKIMSAAMGLNLLFAILNVYFWMLTRNDSMFVQQFVNVLWIFPVYGIVTLFNCKYQTQVLELIYKYKYSEKVYKDQFKMSIKLVTELVYGALLMIGLLIEIELVRTFMPIVPALFLLPLHCWFFSFYICEFKLIYFGKDLHERIMYFERHWLYFLGYGLPLALVYTFLPFALTCSIYVCWSTLLIINTVNIKPKLHKDIHRKIARIPVFCFTKWIAMHIIRIWIHFTA